MNSRKKLWKIFSRATLVFIMLTLAGVQAPSLVQAHDDERQTVNVPLFCTGLAVGQKLRTTLINRGTRRISAQISVFDADGAVVKESPLVVEPGQMSTVEIGREDLTRAERSVMLRTQLTTGRSDARNLWSSSELVNVLTGETQLVVIQIIAILIA